jgi:hypothetical protein
MPRHQEPKKDVANDDTPRGAVSRLRSGDVRMGEPGCGNTQSLVSESIGYEEADEGN